MKFIGETKVRKRILALMLVIVFSLSFLTGCGLVTRNNKNYYEAVVATITYSDGTKDDITKRELITAYSSYGYNYVENYGYTKRKAIETTLDTVIDNYLTRRAVTDYYKAKNEELLNERETTYLWDKTYDAIYSNLKSYLENYVASEKADEDTDAVKSLFKDYVSPVYLNMDLQIVKKQPATTIRGTYTTRYKDEVAYNFEYKKDGKYVFQELMYDNIQKLLETGSESSQRNWKNAFTKYISIIKSNYEYLKKDTNKDWFLFEENRVYEILRNNYLVEKYETIYNTEKAQGANISNVTALNVLKAYADKVNVDYTTYGLEGGSDYAEKMLSDIANMDYILEGSENPQYFYVAPIKVNLAKGESDLITRYKADLKAGTITRSRYNQLIAPIFDKTRELVSVKNATTGVEESKISVKTLKDQIDVALGKYNYDATEDDAFNYNVSLEKAQAYREFFYLYNDDDTYKNADYNAVFGVNTSREALVGSGYDNENIKNAIVNLYNDGNAKIGDVSDIVEGDDGFYIFFYAGKIENLFDVSGSGLSLTNKQSVTALASKRLNIFSSKTLFDKLYEELNTSNFSVFQNMNINRLRNETKSIKSFDANLKDLY